jgi:hypothetical protein
MGWDPNTSVKLFRSQHMAPWTSAAVYECAASQSIDTWTVTKKGFTLVWR